MNQPARRACARHAAAALGAIALLGGCGIDEPRSAHQRALEGSSRVLAVPLLPQQTNQWCWAASAEMMMRHLSQDVPQCLQANYRLGRGDCCTQPVPVECVKPGWPEFDKHDFSARTTDDGALSFAQLKAQIDQGLPVGFSWGWSGGGGHMMVAIGYRTANGKNYVTIHDPWPPNQGDRREISYEAYVSGTYYTHWSDFYNLGDTSAFSLR